MLSSTFWIDVKLPVNVELVANPANSGSEAFQLHIFPALQRLQPVKDRAIFAPWRAGSAWHRFDLGNGLTLHFQIDFGVAIRRGRAGMSQQMADGR